MSNASEGEDAVAVAPGYCLCKGIQHPVLAAFASDEEYCRNNANWSNIQGQLHSSECSFVVDEKGDKKKSRCSKCNNAYTNISRKRTPRLYQENPPPPPPSTAILAETTAAAAASVSTANSSTQTDDAAQPTTTTTINDLILSDVEGVRRRILELLSSGSIEEDDVDLSDTPELAAVAKCLRIKGEKVLSIDDLCAFVACDGDDCSACFIKYNRVNVGTTCNRCKGRKHDVKRYAQRKDDNKEKRVAANSKCPITALDSEERAQRMLNLEIVKKTAKKSLARAFARIEEQKVQANIQGKLLEHLQEAAEAVVNDSNELEETIYQELKKLEAAAPSDACNRRLF